MDLRAPLLDVEDDVTKRNDDLSPPWRRHRRACSKTEYTNNTVESPSTVTNEAKIDPTLYEIIIRRRLCKMHIASIVLELGSESRLLESFYFIATSVNFAAMSWSLLLQRRHVYQQRRNRRLIRTIGGNVERQSNLTSAMWHQLVSFWDVRWRRRSDGYGTSLTCHTC